jgi:hypothetical protein
MFKCPYCGVEILTERAYWGHVEICLENPKNKVIEQESVKEEVKERPKKKKEK